MTAATPAAFQDFGSLVFGDHSLNLEQEIILRGATDRAVQENNLRARAAKLIDQEHLVGVTRLLSMHSSSALFSSTAVTPDIQTIAAVAFWALASVCWPWPGRP